MEKHYAKAATVYARVLRGFIEYVKDTGIKVEEVELVFAFLNEINKVNRLHAKILDLCKDEADAKMMELRKTKGFKEAKEQSKHREN